MKYRSIFIIILVCHIFINVNHINAQNVRVGLPIGHTFVVYTVSFSPDAKRVLTASSDNTVKIWDVKTGKLLLTLEGNKQSVSYAKFSPDGSKIITSSNDNKIKTWDSFSGELIESRPGKLVGRDTIDYSFDLKKYVTCKRDNVARIWDNETGELLITLSGLTFGLNSASFGLDDEMIIYISRDGSLKVWSLNTAMLQGASKVHTDQIISFSLSPDRRKVVSASKDKTAKIWDIETGNLLGTLADHSLGIITAKFSPDGQLIITTSLDKTAKIWDSESYNLLFTLKEHGSAVNCASFRADGKMVVTSTYLDSSVYVWDVQNGTILKQIDGINSLVSTSIFNPKGDRIATACLDGTTKVWDVKSGELLYCLDDNNFFIISVAYTPDGKSIVTTSLDNSCNIWDAETGKLLTSLEGHNEFILSAEISANAEKILTASGDHTAKVWEMKTGKLIHTLEGHTRELNAANFSGDLKRIVTTGDDHKIVIWDTETAEMLLQLYQFKEDDYVSLTPDKYYFGFRGAIKELYWIVDNEKIYTFEQFDLKYNRPDIVLSRLGYASPHLIEAYHQAYLKRLKRMGFTEEQLSGELHVPETIIENFEYMPIIEEEEIEIKFNFNDSKYNLDRYNVWVNEVPLFGMLGKRLDHHKVSAYSITEKIQLSEGKNRIQVSCLNEKGAESYKETVEITYQPKVSDPQKFHFIGIGVDEYSNASYNLNYSVKDIKDLTQKLKEKHGSSISFDTLFNQNVTAANILGLKEKLLKSDVNDNVIISFSGHGLLSSSYDYYLAMHSTNFGKPEEGGLPYEDLEWLLDSIPARKKLLLIDACHSGEVDKEELFAMSSTTNPDGVKGAQMAYEYEPTLGMKNSFELMQELFTNVNRGTGATIISAAAGTQYAYERGDLANGVFTFSILELMNQRDRISVSELKTLVGKRVEELTNGLQKPTSRNENIENDWLVW
jgi:WD40 repeat protein